MSRTKIDYSAAEREYMIGNDSIRSLAARYKVAFSSMAEWARNHEWDRKRGAFRARVDDTALENAATHQIEEKEQALEEAFTLLRATLYEYGRRLKAGEIPMNVKDLTQVIVAMQSLLGQPTSRTEATILGVNITADAGRINLDVLRDLERIARAKLVGGSVEGTPQLLIEGSRPN